MKRILTPLLLLVSFAAGAQHFEGAFTQARTIQASGKVIRSEGILSFTAPDQLAMLYTRPDGDFLIIDGPVVRMDMKGNAATIDTSRNPRVRNLRNTLLNCIKGDYETAAAENDADLSVREKGGLKTVTMTARKTAAKGYSQIVIEYKGGKPVRMVLEEFGGISTEYLLKIQ